MGMNNFSNKNIHTERDIIKEYNYIYEKKALDFERV